MPTPSTTLIANMNTVISNGQKAATTANAINQAGPITDYPGMLQSVLTNLQEAKVKLGGIGGTGGLIGLTDSATDGTNLSLLQNVLASLS